MKTSRLSLKSATLFPAFSEGSDSKGHFGCQLTRWDRCLASEWKLLDPASFPAKIELNSDVASALPQLRRDGLPIARAPNTIGLFTLSHFNVDYGLFKAPETPRYRPDARQAEISANTMDRNWREQGPNPHPPSANSVPRRLHQRWPERPTDAGFRRARGGGQSALKRIRLLGLFPYTSSLLSRR